MIYKNSLLIYVKLVFYILVLGLNYSVVKAQNNINESKRIVDYKSFIEQILKNHPVASQAYLLTDMAKQELRASYGSLDPSLSSKYSSKNLGSVDYYANWANELKIPIWWGTDIKATYDNFNGDYVNNQDITPSKGLTAVGITVPIGQGLIIDERRAAIKQAKVMQKMAEADRVKLINKLILQATKDYRDWQLSFQKEQLFKEGFALADERYNGIKERVIQGDLPAIDSVEASIEAYSRQNIYLQSLLEFQNGALVVSNYIWSANGTPLEMDSTFIPEILTIESEKISADSLSKLLVFARQNHPELIKLNLKISQFEIERKLYKDKLKPKLNVEYNFLQRGFDVPVVSNVFNNNYKFGASFNLPLFLRYERGKYQMAQIKISDTKYFLQQSNVEVGNAITMNYNELIQLTNQLNIQNKIVVNAALMRDGELSKFEIGESSIFLINTREMSLLNHFAKLIEMKAKYMKAIAMLQWSAGKMP